jgi:sugar (pentulose or hexulose) kinase
LPEARETPDCYLGLDLGTSGCRCIAIDDAGEVRAEARAALPGSARPEPGHSQQDPADWWRAARETLAEAVRQRPGRVRAICVDGTSSTLLLCDAHGGPLGPALMYDDRRATRQAAAIEAVAPADCAAHGPGSTLAKLLCLLDEGAADRASHAAHQADWINGRLCGRLGVSDENNALKLGYDPLTRRWPAWLSRLPVPPALLPEVVAVGTPLGPVTATVAADLGLPAETQVIAGTTDSNAATLAAGAWAPGDAVSSLGSTLVLKIVSRTPVFAAAHGVYSHRLRDRWLVGGASNSGGAVLRQFFDDTQLAAFSAQIDPDRPLGLDYYPLPAIGERFPVNDPSLAPRLTPRPASDAAFLQGLFEGIADIEAEGYALLGRLGAPQPRRVLSSGGGAHNPAWTRIRERRLGVPVQAAVHTEAAYGAARLARDGVLRGAG